VTEENNALISRIGEKFDLFSSGTQKLGLDQREGCSITIKKKKFLLERYPCQNQKT